MLSKSARKSRPNIDVKRFDLDLQDSSSRRVTYGSVCFDPDTLLCVCVDISWIMVLIQYCFRYNTQKVGLDAFRFFFNK